MSFTLVPVLFTHIGRERWHGKSRDLLHGLYPLIFVRNVTDNLRYSFNRYSLIKNTVKPSEDLTPYYFDIIKYHSLWKHVSKSNWGYVRFSKKDENSGHLIRDDVIDLSNAWHDYSDITESSPMPPNRRRFCGTCWTTAGKTGSLCCLP